MRYFFFYNMILDFKVNYRIGHCIEKIFGKIFLILILLNFNLYINKIKHN